MIQRQASMILLLVAAMYSFPCFAQQNKPTVQLGKNSVREVMEAMTPEEKVRLLVGNGMRLPGMPQGPMVGGTEDKVPGAAGTTFAIPRLGIPSMVLADGPAGVRISPIRNNDSTQTFYATAFPVGTLLASTWDTALVREVGKAFGVEAREYGIDIILAPALNIHRNPLGGRNFEYFSEDPLISGSMAAAFINGMESNGVGTSIKHFAANNQEKNRSTINTIISERALREIYLRGFEIAVKKAQPWTVMSSYNYINEKYTSEDPALLTTILRNEWGFKGVVMTDWFGGSNPVLQMKAGNDLLMPGTPEQTETILAAVKNNTLDIKVIDTNVERMLNLILQSQAFRNYKFTNRPDLKKNAEVARRVAAEGMVLLKNENVLPLKQDMKIALFGSGSYDLIAGGTGSGDVNEAYAVTLSESLTSAGYTMDESLKKEYAEFLYSEKAKRPPHRIFDPAPPIIEMPLDRSMIARQAETADAAIFTLSRNSGEFYDRKLENDFYLSDAEKKLLQEIADEFHKKNKKLIVVLNIGGVIEMASWRDLADAIILAWQPGQEGGNAIVDILTGKVNPSGKLATTFPMDYKDVPSAKNFPGKEFTEQSKPGPLGIPLTPAEVVYEEGIYTGYRYYNSFKVTPAWPFGFGLSYTTFSFSNLKVNASPDGDVSVTVTITNTGKAAGKEVAGIYISAPGKSLDKPVMELKGFAKTNLLLPGSSQTVRITLTSKDLSSFDTGRSAWIAEAGSYSVHAGNSTMDIKLTTTFNLPREIVSEKVHQVMSPTVPIHEMKR